MAESQPKLPLKYVLKEVATLRASCERHLPASEAATGRFQGRSKLLVSKREDTENRFDVTIERGVRGVPPEADEPVSFAAECVVGALVILDGDAKQDVPADLIREIASPLYFLCAERLREMVVGMGYPPGPALRAMPAMELAPPQPDVQTAVSFDVPRAVRKAPARKTRKTTNR